MTSLKVDESPIKKKKPNFSYEKKKKLLLISGIRLKKYPLSYLEKASSKF
jgi:hypothetical protein